MTARRAPETQPHPETPANDTPRSPVAPPRGRAATGVERPAAPPRSLEEAEAQYVVARDAWTAAMRRASSGRPADLASLAIAQEAYEMASAQRDGWQSGRNVIPVEDRPRPRGVEVIAHQDLAWQRVREGADRPPGRLRRLGRRLLGRS